MTLSTIAYNILSGNKASEIPSTIIGNSNNTAKLVYSAIRKATQFVLWSHRWQRLTETYSFVTVPTQQGYDLPNGINQTDIVPYTLWNQTTRFQLNGPISTNQWQMFTNLFLIPTIIQQWIMLENQIKLYPTPTAAQNLNLLFQSKLCIRSDGGAEQADWEADNDYSILDEYAIELQGTWMYLKQLERPYAEEKEMADNYLAQIIKQDGSRPVIGVNMQSLPPQYPLPSYLNPIMR